MGIELNFAGGVARYEVVSSNKRGTKATIKLKELVVIEVENPAGDQVEKA